MSRVGLDASERATPAPDVGVDLEAARLPESAIEHASTRVDESLSNFIDADRTRRIREFFSRFAVDVPVAPGRAGATRKVAIPFRISIDSYEWHAHNLQRALASAPSRSYLGLVVAGRATPDQLVAVVDDLTRLHPEEFALDRSAEDIRNYLRSNGVGIDCAGSVQLALLDLLGYRADAGTEIGLKRRLDEDLTHLASNPHFRKVADPEHLRPGDLVILNPPETDSVGHTVIVTSRTRAKLTAGEAAALSVDFPDLALPGRDVIRIGVASSFGWDGPEERTWIFDPSSERWGDLGGHLFDENANGEATALPGRHSGPWDHTIEGMYRAR